MKDIEVGNTVIIVSNNGMDNIGESVHHFHDLGVMCEVLSVNGKLLRTYNKMSGLSQVVSREDVRLVEEKEVPSITLGCGTVVGLGSVLKCTRGYGVLYMKDNLYAVGLDSDEDMGVLDCDMDAMFPKFLPNSMVEFEVITNTLEL